MDVKEPTWKELKEVVKKARSGSAPGLNRIPCNLVERDNTGMLEREKCMCWCWQSEFWVYGGEQLHRNNYTQVRHARVLRIYRTHKCHKPSHPGGKERQQNFAAVWLDLANAYGSVPKQLIESAMELYHIPEKVQEIVRSNFGGMKIRAGIHKTS